MMPLPLRAFTGSGFHIHQDKITADSVDFFPGYSENGIPTRKGKESGLTAHKKGADFTAGQVQFQVAHEA